MIWWDKTNAILGLSALETPISDLRSSTLTFVYTSVGLLTRINWIIVTASLLFIKLLYSTINNDSWSKKTTRYFYKRCHNFEKYCVWKGQATKGEACKSNSIFWH